MNLSALVFVLINAFFCLWGLVAPFFLWVRLVYNFNTLVAPGLFGVTGLAAFTLWRKERTRKFFARVFFLSFALALLSIGVRVYATHIEPKRLLLRTLTIKTSKVDRPYRILHISDIQSDAVGDYEVRAFKKMQALRPDLILHTGDLLQPIVPASLSSEVPKIAALFRTLRPPLGIYSVYGDVDRFIHALSSDDLGGVRMLESQEVSVPLKKGRLKIFGLSLDQSRYGAQARPVVARWAEAAAPEDFTLLLGHRPDYVLSIHDLPLDLCLAGHTHGGQIRIPFFGPPVTLSRVPRRLARGYHAVGRTWLNVSAGVGNEHSASLPAIRFNCPTEMTLIELMPDG